MNSYEITLNISLFLSSGLFNLLALNLNIYQSYYIIISYYVYDTDDKTLSTFVHTVAGL